VNYITFTQQAEVEETDVLIVGGGPAGLAAALSSARKEVKTTLVENSGNLGGMATIGLIGPFMTCFSSDGNDQIVKGIFDEVVRRMEKKGGAIHPSHIPGASPYSSFHLIGHDHVTPFDANVLKLVAFELCQEAGVKLKLYSRFLGTTVSSSDGTTTIQEAFIANKSGIQAIRAQRFIDCTGDGDVAAYSGVPMEKGREKDKKMQPASLFFRIGNIDSQKLITFVRKNFPIEQERVGFLEIIKKARKEMNYSVPHDELGLYQTTKWDEWLVNHTRILGVDGTNADDLTQAHMEGQKQVFEALEFMRRFIPGCENVELLEIADQVGVRESRRIQGEYVLKVEDVYNCVPFDDCVVACGFPVDIHDPDGPSGLFEPPRGHHYEIPYRCLLPLKVDNLLVAGRCVSATHEALGAIRVMPFCFAMGEAAGTAAALSVKEGISPKKVNTKKLQKILDDQGAYIPRISQNNS